MEDDEDIRHLLSIYLEKEFQVVLVGNGDDAYSIFLDESPDLIILDIMLPGIDGLELCKMIRKENEDVPIIFLSSRSEYEDRILGLEIGADDYIIKPFDPGEVVARINALMRRMKLMEKKKGKSRNREIIGGLEIDFDDYSIYLHGKPLKLFTKEKQLLFFLIEHPNQVFSHEQLYDRIWGEDKFGDYQTVKVHISNLRKKIEPDPANPVYIQTVRGFGYKFQNNN